MKAHSRCSTFVSNIFELNRIRANIKLLKENYLTTKSVYPIRFGSLLKTGTIIVQIPTTTHFAM